MIHYTTETVTSSDVEVRLRVWVGFWTDTTPGAVQVNPSIKYVRFYRTKANDTLGTAYYVGDVIANDLLKLDLNTYIYVHFYDDIPDTTLGTGQYVAYPKEDHWGNETVDLRTAVLVSNLSRHLEYPELNIIDVYPDDGDKIEGIFDDDNGILVFKTKSICKIFTGGSLINWQTVKIVENIGCDNPDSIIKYENTYFFTQNKRVYVYQGGATKEIGLTFKNTLDSVTEIKGACFYTKEKWYILAVLIGSNYHLLIYDTKMETWYDFTISKADTIIRKDFGNDAGVILLGGNNYLSYYDESSVSDTDTGAQVDITSTIQTKTYTMDDFSYFRLMFLYINYERLLATLGGTATFEIIDPTTGNSRSITDTTENSNRIFKSPTDRLTGTLVRSEKFYLKATGVALKKFQGAKIEFKPETWGVNIKG